MQSSPAANVRSSTPMFLATFLLIMALASQKPVFAQNWQFEPLIRVGGEFDDNAELNFRSDSETELTGLLLEAAATIGYETQLTYFDITPRILTRNYSDEPQFDSEDYFLTSDLRRYMKNNELGFRLRYDNQTTRTAERADVDLDADSPDEIPDDDTGRVQFVGDREKIRLIPYWKTRLTETSDARIQLDYRDVQYDAVFEDVYTDYTDLRLDLKYQWGISDTMTAIVQPTARRYESKDQRDNEISGYGLRAGFNRKLSRLTSLRFLVGFERTSFERFGDETEPVGEITLTQRLETIRLLASYRRTISASGNGRLSLRDNLDLSATRRLNEKISAGVGIRAYEAELAGELAGLRARTFVQLRSRFTWYISPDFYVEFDYRYTVLDRGGDVPESANSNNLVIWFTYEQNAGNK